MLMRAVLYIPLYPVFFDWTNVYENLLMKQELKKYSELLFGDAVTQHKHPIAEIL